jgi:hypothetical protein
MIIIGSNKPDRIYINILIILDNIKNYKCDEKKYYLNDIINNYFCTLYKLLNFYYYNKDNDNVKFVNKIIENFPNDDTKIVYINDNLKKCLSKIELIDEIKPFVIKNHKETDYKNLKVNNKKFSDKEELIFPLVIAGSVTITLGLLIKMLER